MYDFSDYEIEDLFKIRDALQALQKYGLVDEDMLFCVTQEIQRRNDA
jgi:hypothetical protein